MMSTYEREGVEDVVCFYPAWYFDMLKVKYPHCYSGKGEEHYDRIKNFLDSKGQPYDAALYLDRPLEFLKWISQLGNNHTNSVERVSESPWGFLGCMILNSDESNYVGGTFAAAVASADLGKPYLTLQP